MTAIGQTAVPRQLSILPKYPGYRTGGHFMGLLKISLDGAEQKSVLAYDIDARTVTRYATDANGQYRLTKRLDRMIVEQIDGEVDVRWLV